MVAFSGSDPIAILIGAKRPSGTLVHKIAVHPDHRRQGHARHLLTSLGSKLAILGPPRIIAEVPETLAPVRELFSASGYTEEARPDGLRPARVARATRARASRRARVRHPCHGRRSRRQWTLAREPHACWERSVETFTARKDDIAGLAVASDERIEAYLLYVMVETHRRDGGDRVAPLVSSTMTEPVSGSCVATPCARDEHHQVSEGPFGRRCRRSASKRSVSDPAGGHRSTQPRRGPTSDRRVISYAKS